MLEKRKVSRRSVLQSAGAAGVMGLAGCAGNQGSNGDGGTTADNGSNDDNSDSTNSQTTTAIRGDVTVEWGQSPPEITANDVPWAWALRDYIPDKYGYEPKMRLFSGVGAISSAYAAGAVEIGSSSPGAPANMALQGNEIEIIGSNKSGTDYCHVINTDLANDYVDFIESDDIGWGYSGPGGNSHLQPAAAFLANGHDLNKLNFRKIGTSSTRTKAVTSGRLAGGTLHWEQWLQIKDDFPVKNLGRVIDILGGWVDTVFYTKTSWLEENPEVAVDLNEAIIAAYQKANTDFDWFYENWQKYGYEDRTEDDLRTTWEQFVNDFETWPLPEPLKFEPLSYFAETAKHPAVGVLPEDFDYEAIVNLEYQQEAMARLDM